MSRSGYSDDCEYLDLYRQAVQRAIHGKRGQIFLRELLAALDALPEKILITGELINDKGQCCAIGAVCKARRIDTARVVYECPDSVAKAIGVTRSMAAEIAYMNDEWESCSEKPKARWERMRRWAVNNLNP